MSGGVSEKVDFIGIAIISQDDGTSRSADEPRTQISTVKDISVEEADRIWAQVAKCLDAISSQDIWRIVQYNLQHVVEALSVHRPEERHAPEAFIRALVFDLSACLFNLTAAYTAAINHTRRTIVREFGRDSQTGQQFKSLIERSDSYPGHKLIRMMRDFAGHIDLPPISVSMSETKSSKHEVTCHIDIRKAMELDSRTESVWSELITSFGPRVDIATLIESWNEGADDVERFAGQVLEERVAEAFKFVDELHSQYPTNDEQQLAVCHASGTRQELKMTISQIPRFALEKSTKGIRD